MLYYQDHLTAIRPTDLNGGFFEGWPDPPTPENHLRILAGSFACILARTSNGQVVGFATAISDGVSCAYISYLEVLPDYRKNGVGSELLRRLLAGLHDLYMIDLVCDPALERYYRRFELQPYHAMIRRNYDRQSCRPLVTND
jgi:ribosomal protein S18 acetylase RimI-like enzyme